jgi:hypothetical protein
LVVLQHELIPFRDDHRHGLVMLLHVVPEPLQPRRQPMVAQHRRAQFRDESAGIGQRVGEHRIDFFHHLFTGRYPKRRPLALAERQLAEDEHLL